MHLFWKISIGLPGVATLKMFPTFCQGTVCESFGTVHFLRTGASAFAHRTSQIFEMVIIFLPLPLIHFGKLYDTITLLGAPVLLTHTNLLCIVHCGFFKNPDIIIDIFDYFSCYFLF